jgi:alginate production protein
MSGTGPPHAQRNTVGLLVIATAFGTLAPVAAAKMAFQPAAVIAAPRGEAVAPAPSLLLARATPAGNAPAPVPSREDDARAAPALRGLRLRPVEASAEDAVRSGQRVGDRPAMQLAQFQLPEAKPGAKPPAPLASQLTYQYAYGSETTVIYRRDRDLDKRNRDNSNVVAPNVNGIVIYRPTNYLEGTLELIFEREIAINEEATVLLPNGTTQPAQRHRNSLLIDQANVTIRNITAPFEFTVGRKNYEDDRRWLYDTSMDIVSTGLRLGRFRAEALVGREIYRSLELAPRRRETPDHVNTTILYADWRGIEDVRLAAYAIGRHDQDKREGRPWQLGVRVLGTPSPNWNYWGEFALLRGKDELRRKFSGRAFDVGATYRFIGVPYQPNVTLGYAFGSGGNDPDAQKNYEFRQTGLHSNEWKFSGIPQFKVYGEALDPDLTNLGIVTAGVGFYPATRVSVDIVYHRYRLDKIADEVRAAQITAQMAQVDTHLSKDVGSAIDLIVGVRNLFGIRRLGADLRLGWFYPGKAYVRNEGTDADPNIRRANKGIALVAKLWW